jgi:hypothetical protein
MRESEPMSVAFRPSPKDHRKLSTDCVLVTAKESFDGYAARVGHPPNSTWPIEIGTALDAHLALDSDKRDSSKLVVIHDGGTDGLHASHVSIAFSYDGSGKSAIRTADERIAKRLRDEAVAAGCLYRPDPASNGGAKL